MLKIISLLILGVALFNSGPVSAQVAEPSMQARVDSRHPLESSLTLTNTTGESCQVAKTTIGTTAITGVKQGDQAIDPIYFDVAFDQAMPEFLEERLQTLQPGESLTIPLRVAKAGDGHTLEAITWSNQAGAHGMAYKISRDAPLNLALNYELPIQPTKGPPACPMAVVAVVDDKQMPGWVLYVGIGLLGLVLLIVLVVIVILWRRKKHPKKVVAAFFFLGGAAVLLYAAPVQADVSGTESVQGAFDDCMSLLRSHSDITGDVLSTIDNNDIVLMPNNEGENDTADYRPIDGTIRIYWDPNTTHEYHGSGGTSTPCDSLYHEMFHAHDMVSGTYNPRECGGSGIRASEVAATRAQNILRARLGLPERSHYGGTPLPDDCSAPEEPEPCRGADCGESNGDPHLMTFDGLRYDFQAAGEFVLARDTTRDDFEVQVRQTPWWRSRQVAVNQAMAVTIGTDTVELHMRHNEPVLLINGDEQPLKSQKLASGGRIIAGKQRTQLVWPDGSTVTARAIGSFGLHVVAEPAKARRAQLEGILGNYNGTSKDDLRIAGSEQTVEPKFDQLYPQFADSWRVSNETSLFTYADGDNTDTYTDRSFPDADVDISTLPGRAAAEELCRRQGVRDPAILQNCIIDVALTGRAEFAIAAKISQSVTAYGEYGGQTIQLAVKKPGGVAKAQFDAKAGDKVFIDVLEGTFPNHCGTLTVRDPSGHSLATGCLGDDGGYIDTTLLDKAGRYSIALDPPSDTTGQLTLRIVQVEDQNFVAHINGDPVNIDIARPGGKSTIQFEAKAGQHIAIEIPNTTLPDQCGSVVLRDPNGRSIDGGCISGGSGKIGPVELGKTGTYSFTIDPAQKTMGEATVHIKPN